MDYHTLFFGIVIGVVLGVVLVGTHLSARKGTQVSARKGTQVRYDHAFCAVMKAKNEEKKKNWPIAAKMYTDAAKSLLLHSEQETNPAQKQKVLEKANELLERAGEISRWLAKQYKK